MIFVRAKLIWEFWANVNTNIREQEHSGIWYTGWYHINFYVKSIDWIGYQTLVTKICYGGGYLTFSQTLFQTLVHQTGNTSLSMYLHHFNHQSKHFFPPLVTVLTSAHIRENVQYWYICILSNNIGKPIFCVCVCLPQWFSEPHGSGLCAGMQRTDHTAWSSLRASDSQSP